MAEIINNYELLSPFQNQDAGFSRWTYAKRKGKEYFLKEFLDPVYPIEESLSNDLKMKRIRDCEEHEIKKKRLYEAINEASDGNLIRIFEYFRCDSHYYTSTEKIVAQKIPLEAMKAVPLENRILLCKAISHSMMKLHEAHIVHADIKDSNILLKQTVNAKITGKIIDFDCSFFEDEPPQYEDELGGDQVYLAPESCQFICGDPIKLSSKIDVFALGLLFHQYMTGEMPWFDTTEYDYAHEAVLDEQKLVVSSRILPELKVIIELMLDVRPENRPNMEEVFRVFQRLDPDFAPEPEAEPIYSEEVHESEEKEEKKAASSYFFHAGDL